MVSRLAEDLRAALMLLTRLPVWNARSGSAPDLSQSAWAYPLVGLIIGLLAAAGFALSILSGLPTNLAAVIAVTVSVFSTGAFHEDGLADSADGLGGGSTPARKLEIMRDSRIGTFGTIAVVLSLLVRIAGLASIGGIEAGALALVTLNCLTRGVIVALLATLDPARTEGMAAVAQAPSSRVVLSGLLLALAPILVWPATLGAALVGSAILSFLAVRLLCKRQVGGYTGDLLGAGQQISECIAWVTLVALQVSA